MSARAWVSTLVAITIFWALAFTTLAHAKCQTKACWKRVHQARALNWCKHHYPCKYRLLWRQLPAWVRSWVLNTEGCESGHNPRAIGGGGKYRGSMQFDFDTWRAAGGYGDPINASIYEQRVRAALYMLRGHRGAWPVCGR